MMRTEQDTYAWCVVNKEWYQTQFDSPYLIGLLESAAIYIQLIFTCALTYPTFHF